MTRKQLEIIKMTATALFDGRQGQEDGHPSAPHELWAALGEALVDRDEEVEELHKDGAPDAAWRVATNPEEVTATAVAPPPAAGRTEAASVTPVPLEPEFVVDDAGPGAPPPHPPTAPVEGVTWVDVTFTMRVKVSGPLDSNAVATALQSRLGDMAAIGVGDGMATIETHEAFVQSATEVR